MLHLALTKPIHSSLLWHELVPHSAARGERTAACADVVGYLLRHMQQSPSPQTLDTLLSSSIAPLLYTDSRTPAALAYLIPALYLNENWLPLASRSLLGAFECRGYPHARRDPDRNTATRGSSVLWEAHEALLWHATGRPTWGQPPIPYENLWAVPEHRRQCPQRRDAGARSWTTLQTYLNAAIKASGGVVRYETEIRSSGAAGLRRMRNFQP